MGAMGRNLIRDHFKVLHNHTCVCVANKYYLKSSTGALQFHLPVFEDPIYKGFPVSKSHQQQVSKQSWLLKLLSPRCSHASRAGSFTVFKGSALFFSCGAAEFTNRSLSRIPCWSCIAALMSCKLNLFSLERALKTLRLLLQEEEIFLFRRPPFLKMKCSGKFWHSFCGWQHLQHEKPFAVLSFIQYYILESSKPDTLFPFSTNQWQNNLLFFPVLFL